MLVSLVMAVYNGEKYLRETLDSILAQTYKDLEVIIVNDGSTDSTSAILNEIDDERVKIINLKSNNGAASALNAGIMEAKGEWIAIHDADDISIPERIEEQAAYISRKPHLVAIGSYIECIPGYDFIESNSRNFKLIEGLKNSAPSWEKLKEELFKGCPFTHGALFISKKVLLKVGKYNPSYKIAYDYDLMMRLAYAGPVENIPKVLYKYRIYPDSLSNSSALQTSNELLQISTKYIKKYCFPNKKGKLNVLVFGTEEGCKVFKEQMSIDNLIKVREIMINYTSYNAIKAYTNFKEGSIDALIVLPSLHRYDLVSFLRKKGLKLNKNIFILWSAL